MKLILVLLFGFVMLTACANQHNELQTEIEILQEVITSLEDKIEELNARQVEDLPLDEDIDAIRVDFMENAGGIISNIMGLEINFASDEVDFGLFNQGYVWALGHWETDALYLRGASQGSVQVLFRYSRFDNDIIWRVKNFTIGDRVGVPSDAFRYQNHRDYLDEYILVRFYDWRIEENGAGLFLGYTEIYALGIEEMIILTHEHFGAYVLDMQVVNNRGITRLYVNFHPRGIPTEGAISPDYHWYERLILTFTSITEIDEVVMLMGGIRNGVFGGQGGLWFDDVYRENDPWLLNLRSR